MDNQQKIDLEFIFQKQKELNQRIQEDLYESLEDPELRRKWFFNYILALQQEVAEAVDSVQWKWWKFGEDRWDNVKIELIDILHFWVSLCQVAGMDAGEVKQLYAKKNALNHTRQDSGYKEGFYKKYVDGKEDNELLLK